MFSGYIAQPIPWRTSSPEHVVQQRAESREDDALDRTVADVPFVPQGDVLQAATPPQHAGQSREALPGDGIPACAA